MVSKYKKIVIIGGSGAGKSTLARLIHKKTSITLYHLDQMFLNSDWSHKEESTWNEISREFLTKDEGIVDGTYFTHLKPRLKWADLIIFIDNSSSRKVFNVFKRFFRIALYLEQKMGFPQGSKNRLNSRFVRWTWEWNKDNRDLTLRLLNEIKDKKVVIINKVGDINIDHLLYT